MWEMNLIHQSYQRFVIYILMCALQLQLDGLMDSELEALSFQKVKGTELQQ